MAKESALQVVTRGFAKQIGFNEETNTDGLLQTLKATAFKGQNVTADQMFALITVAKQYSLNPWTNQIYAFPAKGGHIVPIVGVDGWSQIMNNHPQFDGMDFEQDSDSCTCIIYRKDRTHPVKVTEYLSECDRGTLPWKSHPKRMLRHKAMMQCARLAFGFTGIFDQDEGETILHNEEKPFANKPKKEKEPLPNYPKDKFKEFFPDFVTYIQSKTMTKEEVKAKLSLKGVLTQEQEDSIDNIPDEKPIEETKKNKKTKTKEEEYPSELVTAVNDCENKEELDALFENLADDERQEYGDLFEETAKSLK